MLKYVMWVSGVCGIFPYWFDAKTNNFRLRFNVYFYICTVIGVICNAFVVLSLVSAVRGERQNFDVQITLLILIHGQTMLLMLKRIIGMAKTKNLFENVFKLHPVRYKTTAGGSNNGYARFIRNTVIVYAITVIELIEIIGCHAMKSIVDDDPFIVLKYGLPICVLVLQPVALELQYEFAFVILEEQFRILNSYYADVVIGSSSSSNNENNNNSDDNATGYRETTTEDVIENKNNELYRLRNRHRFLSNIVDKLNEHFAFEFLMLCGAMSCVSFYLTSDLIFTSNDPLSTDIEVLKYITQATVMVILHIRLWYLCTHIDRMIHQVI